MHTANAVLIYYISALLLIGVGCTETLKDVLQIFKAKIWFIRISVIRDVRRIAVQTGQLCRTVTTRSK